MPAYNFKKEFADAVACKLKRCTIRRRRKRPTGAGDTLYHYTGMRTKNCRKLLQIVCEKVTPLEIVAFELKINGRYANDKEKIQLAERDGFDSVGAFFTFFHKQYGYAVDDLELIEW